MHRSIGVLLVAVALSGCAARVKTVTNLPAGVTQQQAQSWDTAVANVHKIADGTSAARQAVIAANKQGVFPDGPAYITTLEVLGRVDKLQLASDAVLKQSPNNFSDSTKAKIQANMQQISAQLTTLNQEGLTGIKSSGTQQQVGQLITEVTSAVALILTL
jgi:hypothetical protein